MWTGVRQPFTSHQVSREKTSLRHDSDSSPPQVPNTRRKYPVSRFPFRDTYRHTPLLPNCICQEVKCCSSSPTHTYGSLRKRSPLSRHCELPFNARKLTGVARKYKELLFRPAFILAFSLWKNCFLLLVEFQ